MHLLDPVQPAAHPGRKPFKGQPQIHRIIAQGPAFLGPAAALFDRDDVALPAPPQRIADQMPPRPHMHLGQRCGILRLGQNRPPGHLPGEHRHCRPVQRRTRARLQPVRPDQQVRHVLRPLRGDDARARPRQIDRLDPLQQAQLHPGLARTVQQQGNQIGPVEQAEVPPPQVHRQHRLGRWPVDQPHPCRRRSGPVQRLAQAQRAQHRSPVGRNLQTCADLADRIRLFQHRHLGPAQRQGARAGQAGDARAQKGDALSDQAHAQGPETKNAGVMPRRQCSAVPRPAARGAGRAIRRGARARGVRAFPALPASSWRWAAHPGA